jgi:hypothetical protein
MAATHVAFATGSATGGLATANAAILKRELRVWMDEFQSTNGRGKPHLSLPLYWGTGSLRRAALLVFKFRHPPLREERGLDHAWHKCVAGPSRRWGPLGECVFMIRLTRLLQ